MAKRILFTSPGRRFELINFFRQEFTGYEFIGGDAFNTSPASYILDRVYKLPLKIDEEYINEVINVCKKENPEFIVLLLDPEIYYFSKYKKLFNEINVHVWVPDYETVKLTNDKYLMYEKFKSSEIAMPQTWLLKDFLHNKIDAPYDKFVVKPRTGSASKGIYKVPSGNVSLIANSENLDKDLYLVQQQINFDYEVTVDLYSDGKGNVIEYCQRKRISVRAGEIEKGVTVNIPRITDAVKKVAGELAILGVINIQLMLESEKVYLGEINARFGGGYTLSHHAGANMIQHMKAYMKNTAYKIPEEIRYKENFYMLRFDNAVYTDKLLDLI